MDIPGQLCDTGCASPKRKAPTEAGAGDAIKGSAPKGRSPATWDGVKVFLKMDAHALLVSSAWKLPDGPGRANT